MLHLVVETNIHELLGIAKGFLPKFHHNFSLIPLYLEDLTIFQAFC